MAAGLVLFAYITSHFLNHALGNISLGAMDDMLLYQMLFWQSWPMLIVFYGATLIHMGLGLWALYVRRQFRWTAIEATQLLFGLSIPLLIMQHFIGTRLSSPLFGIDRDYSQVFFTYWVAKADGRWLMYAALLQDMTKALSCEVVVSRDVLNTAALPAENLPRIEVPIRGRVEPLLVHTVEKAEMLSAVLADFAVAAA